MSNKRKQDKLRLKRAVARIEEEQGRVDEMVRQRRMIYANQAQQAPNNSYGAPTYYIDIKFKCIDCGVREIWTAKQQQWYYEVAKGSIYGTAVRCRACRNKRRDEKAAQAQHMEELRLRREEASGP